MHSSCVSALKGEAVCCTLRKQQGLVGDAEAQEEKRWLFGL